MSGQRQRAAAVILGLSVLTACAVESTSERPARARPVGATGLPDDRVPDAPAAYQDPTRPAVQAGRRPGFCERSDSDAVRDIFCVDTPPAVTSLRVLQELLQVNPAALSDEQETAVDPASLPATSASDTLVDVAVFLSHSTALSGHLVSPINPRAIFLGQQTILTFQRGIQQIEFATQSRERGDFNFYLLTFSQACSTRPEGCKPGDLYTPRVESNWADVALRDDEDLKNTTADCRQCHQRGSEFSTLLMRELQAPWTHFFEPDTESDAVLPGVRGADLVRDYLRAKGNEGYAGLSTNTLRHTVGLFLQNVVEASQPLLFPAPIIEDERWPFVDGAYPSTPRESPTWERAYEAFKRGEQLALPYYEPRPSDLKKQQRLTEAYAAYRRGELPADELPDLSDIFPDDPALRARIGLQTEPGATAPEALVQACGSCHNDVLDQTISRARFNVDLARMSRAELDSAIARLQLPSHSPAAMPPREARQLDEEGRERLIEYLQKNVRTQEEDAFLSHAAEAGMAGGRRP